METQKTKRRLFVSTHALWLFSGYVAFSLLVVFLFLGWESLIQLCLSQFPGAHAFLKPAGGFPMVVKLMLLLSWGALSFLMSFTYLDQKFMLIFNRMNKVFHNMLTNTRLKLFFRKNDSFALMAESFNEMNSLFLTRIDQREKVIEDLLRELETFPESATREQVQNVIQKIDRELALK